MKTVNNEKKNISSHLQAKPQTLFVHDSDLHCISNGTNHARKSLSFNIRRAGERFAACKKPTDISGILQESSGFPVDADDVLMILPIGLHREVAIILPVPPPIALLTGRQHDLYAASPDQTKHARQVEIGTVQCASCLVLFQCIAVRLRDVGQRSARIHLAKVPRLVGYTDKRRSPSSGFIVACARSLP